jgi:predicted amidophosphoribosyltransferase
MQAFFFMVPALILITSLNFWGTKFCPACGKTMYNAYRAQFCSRCGQPLVQVESEPPDAV